MRRILIVGILLLCAGCQNVVGPFRADSMRVDDPCLTMAEQQRWGRAKLALPEESSWIMPPGQTRPGAWGTQMH
jgi:hypothetical protein